MTTQPYVQAKVDGRKGLQHRFVMLPLMLTVSAMKVMLAQWRRQG
jgi:hypothetical protein